MAACLTPSCFHNVFLLYKKVFPRLLTPTYDKLTSTHAPKNSTVEVHHLYHLFGCTSFFKCRFRMGACVMEKWSNCLGLVTRKSSSNTTETHCILMMMMMIQWIHHATGRFFESPILSSASTFGFFHQSLRLPLSTKKSTKSARGYRVCSWITRDWGLGWSDTEKYTRTIWSAAEE